MKMELYQSAPSLPESTQVLAVLCQQPDPVRALLWTLECVTTSDPYMTEAYAVLPATASTWAMLDQPRLHWRQYGVLQGKNTSTPALLRPKIPQY